MLYFIVAAFYVMVHGLFYNNPNGIEICIYNVVCYVRFPFIWGTYTAYTYQILIFGGAYFWFYKKFKWKSPFMFMLVWSFSDIFYNVSFYAFHIQETLAGKIPYLVVQEGTEVYLLKTTIECLIFLIAVGFLRPKFDLRPTPIKITGLILIIGALVWNLIMGYPFLGALAPDTLILQIQAFVGSFGLVVFMYSVIVPSKSNTK